ncbi:MAG: PIN domain-containing protein [Bifidobacteriaceae bacterium]|jgi:toxin-antitoxin system PIN domain toxin|nr:PIN domain-containing protein [Bifidobacteriaceae bacterium]
MTSPAGALYLLDANVLLALTHAGHLNHARATSWLASAARWATAPATESALIRLLLNRAVVGAKVTGAQALGVLRSLRDAPGHEFLPDGTSLADPAINLTGLMGHRQVTDLHLVNLAARNGAVLATFDARIEAALSESDAALVHVI